MKKIELNSALIDSYYALLKRLSHKVRVELIARLSDSLQLEDKRDGGDFFSLFGAYQSEKTADEIIRDLKDSRTFKRQTEEL